MTRDYVLQRLAEIKGEIKPGPVQIVPKPSVVPLRYRYALRVTGPGMDTHITLDCIEDIEIAELVLQKLRRNLERA